MIQKNMRITGRPLFIVAALFLGAACSQPAMKREAAEPIIVPPGSADDDRRVLAGEWEYEEGAIVILKLDERGNGTYAWKDGRFETTVLSGRTWQGMWFQRENDREGGFTVEFSPDFSEGDGRWWYTRIGQDRTPSQKGGTFHLSKIDGTTTLSQTPFPP